MHSTTFIWILLAVPVAAFLSSSSHCAAKKHGVVASETALAFGIPSFLTPQNENINATATAEKKIGLSGIVQLITAGAGAPFLGDFEGVDKESGKFMFSLEANNFADEKGNSKQTQMPYFESGWVDPNDEGFKWPWEKKKQ